tara:strand:+ start:351 stop:482 length:132 start_codon:yes stop_codon:yes gene_type:complete
LVPSLLKVNADAKKPVIASTALVRKRVGSAIALEKDKAKKNTM